MFVAFTFLQLLIWLDEEGGSWSRYLNYPGAELWKFLNLLLFIAAAVYLLRRPLSDALRSRRERIKRELLKAREEKERALMQLAAIESKLQTVDAEMASIREKAMAEAEAEAERIRQATEVEMAKVREQAQREIEGVVKAAKHELRQFAAEQSIRIAEAVIRRDIRPQDDARLIEANVAELGRRRK